MEEQGSRTEKPMKPQVVAWELGKRLRQDAIVSSDSAIDPFKLQTNVAQYTHDSQHFLAVHDRFQA